MTPLVIGIAGESGVGKSTIAEVLSFYFDDVLLLSNDDLHKWERDSKNWKIFTHANPLANKLDLGDIHLELLKDNIAIARSHYNHTTGQFDTPYIISPRNVIIIDGLHAFFTDLSKKLIDIKIYVCTEDSLKRHWKIVRDVSCRGHTIESVMDSIRRRELDYRILEENQLPYADIIVNISSDKIDNIGDVKEIINVATHAIAVNDKHPYTSKMSDFLNNFNAAIANFNMICKSMGQDSRLFPDAGGNISVKIDENMMLIKASGVQLSNFKSAPIYSIVNRNSRKPVKDGLKPSMELDFHLLLKDKYVIHTHPIYALCLLCLEDSRKYIAQAMRYLDFEHIDYVTPGKDIADRLSPSSSTVLLDNHGLICSGNDIREVINRTCGINNICRYIVEDLLKELFIPYSEFHCQDSLGDKFLFPDAYIFRNTPEKSPNIIKQHHYIEYTGSKISSLRYLRQHDLEILNNMEDEKYRLSR